MRRENDLGDVGGTAMGKALRVNTWLCCKLCKT